MRSRWILPLILICTLKVQAADLDINFRPNCDPSAQQVTLALTGDVLVHDALYREAMGSSERFWGLWKKTRPLFAKADFSYANLEGPVALGIDADGRDHGDVGFIYDLNIYSGTHFSFNYHPSILLDLSRLGLNLLSTANNHALDRGALGIDRTIEAFAQSDLQYVGTRLSSARNADFYKIVHVKGFNLAWISCTEMTNGNSDRKGQVLYCYDNEDEILRMIHALAQRRDVDAIILTPHWGEEYSPAPNARQVKYAHKYLDAGVTAIVGSHPHVLQPWEKHITPDGRETLVVYSLGNFLAYQATLPRKASAVVYLQLSRESQQKARLSAVAYSPTYRDGTEVFPTSMSEVLDHEARYYGRKNLRRLSQGLWENECH